MRRTRSVPARSGREQTGPTEQTVPAGKAGTSGAGFAGQTDQTGRRPRDSGPPQENAGWTIFSYLIAGMVAYGLIGWLAAWLTHISVLIPLGALVGLVTAVIGVFVKYGRP